MPTDTPTLSTRAWTGLAFLYWLAFMAVLVPGNLAGALQAGAAVDWGRQAIRLLGAATLGASATPALLALARRFPLARPLRASHAAAQALGVAGLAIGLILVSCLLAAWLLEHRALPAMAEVRQQLTANSLLLIFSLALLLAVIQVVGRARPLAKTSWPAQLTIGEGGRLQVIAVAAIDWIETQGNYQALHLGPETRLVRETSARLAARLDPDRFVRIHRRAIVAVDRVRRLEPLANGDAQVTLSDGVQLRVSRGHRQALRERMASL
ncbi:hypothetical protein QO010_003263 [Caulobacter ginsengisoli]|uniref:HTH LytTR-type domain-containing protein n=1 Tax=Caulobacter ginsengisoli TaxID=400775 RepID=A0ABU0ITZ6_9CAUL|nr:LytTR family DNA-binding domain-containing protein [Caulobacter ginsengisoli]MDQ0465474.1 hypothetical protein [Caulobacter ginsengisoli]